ncbi:hypothetical protein ACOME3_004560 [Neoechinorhynchus agilis]
MKCTWIEALDSAGLQLLIVGLAIPTFIRIAVYILKIVYTFYVFKLKSRSALLSPKYMGEWAVVTGSTDGIGLEYAKQLAEIGFNIVLVSRSQEKLDNVRSQIVSECPEVQVCTIQADFSLMSPKEYDRIENELIRKIGPVDDNLDIGILVNNAGVCYDRSLSFEDVSPILINQITQVNVSSVFHMTRMILPHMLHSNKNPLILNIGSVAGINHFPFKSAYSASKASIISFSRALESELSSTNVDVQCVCPGLVVTKMILDDPSLNRLSNRWYVLASADFVKSALNSIGSLRFTCGCLAHYIYWDVIFPVIPRFLIVRNIRMTINH